MSYITQPHQISHYLQGVPLASIRRREKADLENVVYILFEKP